MLSVRQATAFRRDIRRLTRQGADMKKLETVVRLLVAGSPLEPRHRDHPLSGNSQERRMIFNKPTDMDRTG